MSRKHSQTLLSRPSSVPPRRGNPSKGFSLHRYTLRAQQYIKIGALDTSNDAHSACHPFQPKTSDRTLPLPTRIVAINSTPNETPIQHTKVARIKQPSLRTINSPLLPIKPHQYDASNPKSANRKRQPRVQAVQGPARALSFGSPTAARRRSILSRPQPPTMREPELLPWCAHTAPRFPKPIRLCAASGLLAENVKVRARARVHQPNKSPQLQRTKARAFCWAIYVRRL